jgi:hypothetical protein
MANGNWQGWILAVSVNLGLQLLLVVSGLLDGYGPQGCRS